MFRRRGHCTRDSRQVAGTTKFSTHHGSEDIIRENLGDARGGAAGRAVSYPLYRFTSGA